MRHRSPVREMSSDSDAVSLGSSTETATRSRYRSSVPSQARDQVARPPSSRGRLVNEDDELDSLPSSLSANLGVDQSALEIARCAEASGYTPAPWVPSPALPEAPTWYSPTALPAGGPWEGAEGGDSRQSTVPPPTLPSFSSIGAAINAIHRLSEFFASEDVPMATQPAVRDAITQTTGSLGALTEVFSPCAEEASPGTRLMDLYRSQVTFDGYDSYGDEPLNRRRTEVNTLFNVARGQPRTVCFGTDASVPKTTTRHHTTAAFVCEGLINLSYSSAWAAGKVLASDGELFAIRSAIVKGCSFEYCDRIVLFTDSIGMAKRAVDPSVHSGQAHSLALLYTGAQRQSGR
ncbi:hypothetical protein FA13DRAFT_1787556 [Coprinellus micaceus]|uniref:Uncharacterized protein n=1 Tax=Coprinellus micaceus TaxID=71717 RepID=A0A4Y7TPH7_COPMI|nr:hypothetical protein FA13DRAFT_1787556 [Coprinellus micaceus]